ncbi:Ankyrin repeat [Arabidopsis suecica]|uniref:Ankyrin repeat n=1 Tax=Arabidopsis suecica TaxID=45249 RepID=A0A8T2H0Z9_ARASU|nr:Ankyrin repeat [Arabidopsis suecica]
MQPIFQAILRNDVPAFLGLVAERDSWLEERSDEQHSNTVLHMAAKHGHGELVSKIIELRPSLVYSRNRYGNTPLHLAALLGDVNIVTTMLEFGLKACSARNNNNQTPLHLACRSISMEAARLVAEKTQSIGLDELNFALSSGSTCIAGIILERFPDLAREEAWVVEGGSLATLLHHACDRGDYELTCILLGLDQRLEEAINTNGLSPLHLAVLRGSVVILEEFLEKAPLSFSFLTPSKETVFHLAARNKNIDAFVFMAESVGINSQILLQQTDENGNTVLHVAASMACCAPLIRYIVGKKMVDIGYKNKMGFAATDLLPQEAEDFELLSSWLRFDTELDTKNTEVHDVPSNPFHKRSLERVKTLDSCISSKKNEVIRLLELIETKTSEIAEIKRSKKGDAERGRKSMEYEMHIEALQNARNTIAIVAVLIASVSYAGGINPPGGVYQDGPWRGKSIVGNTAAFKVFAICNNIALFMSLCIVILLVSIIPYKRKPLKRLLVATHRMMWVSVGFMATAYVAASWVTIPHLHGTRWLFPAIVSVAGGSLTVLFSYLGVETIGHWCKKMNRVGDIPVYYIKKRRVGDLPPFARTSSDHLASGVRKSNLSEGDMPSFARTNSDLAASGKSGYFTY